MDDLPGPGETIDGFLVGERIHAGGMGVVHRVTRDDLAFPAVMKLPRLGPGEPATSVISFEVEQNVLAALHGPHVPRFVAAGDLTVRPYLVMEEIAGRSLAEWAGRAPLPAGEVARLGIAVASALDALHRQEAIHLDLKPSNVLLRADGTAVLIDLGLAHHACYPDLLAEEYRRPIGSAPYLSPEQVVGVRSDPRSDLFSLGVVLYECVTGQLPFSGTSTFDYVRHLMQSPPRRLDRLAPHTPADLVDLIERCLEKTPAARPQSADEVVAALRQLSSTLTATGVLAQSVRQARASRRLRLVAIAAVAVAAAAVGWRIWWPRGGDPPLFRRPFVTSAALKSDSRVSPDAQWVSYLASNRGSTGLLVQRIDGGEERPVTLGPGVPRSHVWSPDGRQLACVMDVNDTSVLQIYPAFFGGAPVETRPLPAASRIRLLRWVGRAIYLEVQGPSGVSLHRLDLDGTGAAAVTNLSAAWSLTGMLRGVDVAPDGRDVAFTLSADGQEDLWTAHLDGTGARALTADAALDRQPLWSGERVIFQSSRSGQLDLWAVSPRTGALVQLTSGETQVAEGASPDGAVVSVQLVTDDAKLWLWGSGASGGQQLTQDALSDFAPVIAPSGSTLAFQRSQPTPVRGHSLLDSRIFVAPFDGRQLAADPRPIDDGFAVALSADGQWAAYLQPAPVEGGVARCKVVVRNLETGAVTVVTSTTPPPTLSNRPLDWVSTIMAWSPAAPELFFVSQEGVPVIRRFRAGSSGESDEVVRSGDAAEQLRDLSVSPDGTQLGYLAASRGGLRVQAVTLGTRATRVLTEFKSGDTVTSAFGRGWTDEGFVIARRTAVHPDFTSDVEILVAGPAAVRRAGVVTNAALATTRLHAARRVVYVTRLEQGAYNLSEFDLATGAVRAVTANVLPGVTFSGFTPAGAAAVVGIRQERRQDIWLLEARSTAPTGKPAGR
jgi:Tol biopolymer transport system component